MKLPFCITFDEHFLPMCYQLVSNLDDCKEDISIRLNKITTKEDNRHFGSISWYDNLSQKIVFLMRNMLEASEGEVICVSDADIQFFRPHDLIDRAKYMMESDTEYMGQREGGTVDENSGGDFNGGFLLIKKNERTVEFVRRVCEVDLRKYRLADQEVINHHIRSMDIKAKFLEARKYVHGCCIGYDDYVGMSNSENIVMHHATCCLNRQEKMHQMNMVRWKMGFEIINWSKHVII